MKKLKSGFHKDMMYHVTCSKCDRKFTSHDEIGQTVYSTKVEAIEDLLDYEWSVNGNVVLCDDCKTT